MSTAMKYAISRSIGQRTRGQHYIVSQSWLRPIIKPAQHNVYCLPSLRYGCETWTLNDQSINRVNVAGNNSFRHIFFGFWWESMKPLQYFCQTLPISYFIDQRKLLFWRKLAMHNNNFLLSLSRLAQNRFYAIRSLYGITSASVGQIKSAIWAVY